MLTQSSEADDARPATAGGQRPLKVMFVLTFMPVGGAETLLVNLIRGLDRRRFAPEVCCLKYLGPLGEQLAAEIPTSAGLLHSKYDLAVLPRLTRLMRQRRVDAVVTVGTGGDKMFWGRLAAWGAGAPVVASALHSTGLPDRVEPLNRLLAPWTDAFIAVAPAHGQYLAAHEGCPADKVWVIPNGVDVARFAPSPASAPLRASLNLGEHQPVAAIVAALRPEKNHELFLQVAQRVGRELPRARFLVIGDGPRRGELEELAGRLQLDGRVRFLGSRSDIPELLSLVDVVMLTSHMEANPVSLLEAMACGRPVIAPSVGSIPQTVTDGVQGLLCPAGDLDAFTAHAVALLSNPALAARMGQAGRQRVVENYSLKVMIDGYQRMIETIYRAKRGRLPYGKGSAEIPAADESGRATRQEQPAPEAVAMSAGN